MSLYSAGDDSFDVMGLIAFLSVMIYMELYS